MREKFRGNFVENLPGSSKADSKDAVRKFGIFRTYPIISPFMRIPYLADEGI
jgi:hypothetical protein